MDDGPTGGCDGREGTMGVECMVGRNDRLASEGDLMGVDGIGASVDSATDGAKKLLTEKNPVNRSG